MMHIMNTGQLLVELRLSGGARGMRPADFAYALAWGLLYIFFAWVWHARTGLWSYPFLDYTHPYSWASYAALLGALATSWWVACRLCAAAAAGRAPTLARRD